MTTVVLLHGWPGSTDDYRRVLPLLEGLDTYIPELFQNDDASADDHAARILAATSGDLIPVGYDIGSRIGQAIARLAPERVRGLVTSPAYPGMGDRPFQPDFAPITWYQHFHRNGLAAELIDGNERAVRAYLTHIYGEWTDDESLLTEELIAQYSVPGAFRASIAWYSANRGYAGVAPVAVPTIMLWPDADVLFPVTWADRLDEWFVDAELRIIQSGHFVPLEAPRAVADAIRELAQR